MTLIIYAVQYFAEKNPGSWQSCGCHLTQSIRQDSLADQGPPPPTRHWDVPIGPLSCTMRATTSHKTAKGNARGT